MPERGDAPAAYPRRPRLRAGSFAVYYGFGPLPGLETFDLAFLEPAGWRASDIARLRANGVRTFAYLSLLEAPDAVYRKAGLGPEDLLRPDGRPWRKEEYGSWVVNPRSTRWKAYISARLTSLVAGDWDGIFLDTLGDVEDEQAQTMTGWLLPAAAELVHLARSLVKDRFLIQNNGVWLLLPLTAPYLDGICHENPALAGRIREAWATAALEALVDASVLHGLLPLLLSCITPGPTADQEVGALAATAARLSCVAYAAPGDYTTGVRLADGRIARAPH